MHFHLNYNYCNQLLVGVLFIYLFSTIVSFHYAYFVSKTRKHVSFCINYFFLNVLVDFFVMNYWFVQVIGAISLVLILGSLNVKVVECKVGRGLKNTEYYAINCRKHSAVLTDFGGVGDGKTSNTKAFQSAIRKLGQYASDGGAQLIVPPGKWLTGPFNLTSHFTLFLHKDAVILASQVFPTAITFSLLMLIF